MFFWVTVGLVVFVLNVAAVVLGWRLRSVQPYHLIPPETHRFPEPVHHCSQYMETAAGGCLWTDPGSNGLACSLRPHRACTRFPQEIQNKVMQRCWDYEKRAPQVFRQNLQVS